MNHVMAFSAWSANCAQIETLTIAPRKYREYYYQSFKSKKMLQERFATLFSGLTSLNYVEEVVVTFAKGETAKSLQWIECLSRMPLRHLTLKKVKLEPVSAFSEMKDLETLTFDNCSSSGFDISYACGFAVSMAPMRELHLKDCANLREKFLDGFFDQIETAVGTSTKITLKLMRITNDAQSAFFEDYFKNFHRKSVLPQVVVISSNAQQFLFETIVDSNSREVTQTRQKCSC